MDPRIKKILVPNPEYVIEPLIRQRTRRSDYSGNGHWHFDEPLGCNKEFGFIYIIRDCVAGMSYIGKKQFVGHGSDNRGEVSNWPWYTSSSKMLSAKIHAVGKETFEFIAIEQYRTKGGLGFAETWSLMFVESPYNQDKWYNRLIPKVSWVSTECITDRHKFRLQQIVSGEPLAPLEI